MGPSALVNNEICRAFITECCPSFAVLIEYVLLAARLSLSTKKKGGERHKVHLILGVMALPLFSWEDGMASDQIPLQEKVYLLAPPCSPGVVSSQCGHTVTTGQQHCSP